MELISYIICILTLDLIGRRFLHSGMLLFCGVMLTIHTVLKEYAVDEAGIVIDESELTKVWTTSNSPGTLGFDSN